MHPSKSTGCPHGILRRSLLCLFSLSPPDGDILMTISPLPPMEGPVCPLPLHHDQTVVMGHGSGGRMTHELIQNTFLPHLSSPWNSGNDFAALTLPKNPMSLQCLLSQRIQHLQPVILPRRRHEAGSLWNINDISMSGATPLYLTVDLSWKKDCQYPCWRKSLHP
jgi:hypothetical protein